MSWRSPITCLSTITPSTGGGLGGLTPRKVRPLIWNMVGESFSLVGIATLTVNVFGFFLPTPPHFLPHFKCQTSCWRIRVLRSYTQEDVSEPRPFLLHSFLRWARLVYLSFLLRDRGRPRPLLYVKLPLH